MRVVSARKISLLICIFIFVSAYYVFCEVSEIKAEAAPLAYQNLSSGETLEKIKQASDLINSRSYRKAEEILLDIVRNNVQESNLAVFLLGKLYKEEGSFEKAENFLMKAAEANPLVEDYAFKLLVEIYTSARDFEKIVNTSNKIRNFLLLQYAKQSEINALLSLKKEQEAEDALSDYVEVYSSDWDYKLTFASLLRKLGKIDQAVHLLKEIYINAVPESNSASKELQNLKADTLTKEEILKRADNLFEKNNYQRAELEYQKALEPAGEFEKDKIRMSIAMCQFRLKQYTKAAKSFEAIKTSEALYWQAYSFYRIDDRAGFEKVKKELAAAYPGDERLALLLLMEGEDFRREGEFERAGRSFKEIISKFPAKAEDALWGLGWMSYASGNYNDAAKYFSQLTVYDKSDNYYKYLYWSAKSSERANEECLKQRVSSRLNDTESCAEAGKNFFSGLPFDRSFYGYLIKMRLQTYTPAERIEPLIPARPEGEAYVRIDLLALLGMRDEAVSEIVELLKNGRSKNDFMYLGQKAMELGEYKKIIALTEKETGSEYFPYSFPFGFGEIIEEAVGSKNVDKYLVAALIREESRFDPKAVSWAGAMGLMQLMPATAYRLKKDIKLPLKDRLEIHDVRKNITLGTYYIAGLIKQFKEVPFALAAYNAGETALKRWMEKYNKNDIVEFIENIPYKETRFYVKRVLRSYWRYRSMNGLPVEASQIFTQGKI